MKADTSQESRLDDTLKPKQEAAALALAAGRTQDEAARDSGVGKPTIETWLATQPAFEQRIQELRIEATARAVGKLTVAMVSAVDTLDHLSRKSRSETVRLRAARAILEDGSRLRETIESQEKIARVFQDAGIF